MPKKPPMPPKNVKLTMAVFERSPMDKETAKESSKKDKGMDKKSLASMKKKPKK